MGKIRTTTTLIIFVLVTGCQSELKGPTELWVKDEPVVRAKTLSELPAVTPIAVRLDKGGNFFLEKLQSQLNLKSQLGVTVVPLKDEQSLERDLSNYLQKKEIRPLLQLAYYARRLHAGHPHRVNPFMPFFAFVPENKNSHTEDIGPSTFPPFVLKYHGLLDREAEFYDQGKLTRHLLSGKLDRSISSSALFFSDSETFNIVKLIKNDRLGIFNDILAHELTHLWLYELTAFSDGKLLSRKMRETQNGEDGHIVTNPTLAFQEGIALAFETIFADYGVLLSDQNIKSRRELLKKKKQKLPSDFSLIIGRQDAIRSNLYLYNLYDYEDCSLREAYIPDASSITKLVLDSSLLNDKQNAKEKSNLYVDFAHYKKRFYSDEDLRPKSYLREHCKINTPPKLEATQGFVASMIYRFLISGALATDLESPFRPRVLPNEQVDLFLSSFTTLVTAISKSQSHTLKELLDYLFQSDFLPEAHKKMLAYDVLKISRGALSSDPSVQKHYISESVEKNSRDQLMLEIEILQKAGALNNLIALMNTAPAIYLSFPTKLSDRSAKGEFVWRRININAANAIDLIDMFEGNGELVQLLLARLQSGKYIKTKRELLDLATLFGLKEMVESYLNRAETEIKKL